MPGPPDYEDPYEKHRDFNGKQGGSDFFVHSLLRSKRGTARIASVNVFAFLQIFEILLRNLMPHFLENITGAELTSY